MAASNEVAARIMEHLVAHDGDGGHGYSQGSNRWGNGVLETLEIDGHAYRFAGGDRDCSSGVISAYEAAGVDCGGATYTGNMRVHLCSTGNFEWKPMSYTAQRGDIYLNERSHTALCKSAVPDMLMQFSIDENGGIMGGREGDQTGSESNTRPYYDYPWDGILRFVGEGGAPAQGTQSSTIPDIRYRACSQAQGWLPEMLNHFDPSGSGDDYAGDGSPIIYLAVDMPGWYQARTQSSGWLPPVRGYDADDLEYGCAGDGTPITGIRCYSKPRGHRLARHRVRRCERRLRVPAEHARLGGHGRVDRRLRGQRWRYQRLQGQNRPSVGPYGRLRYRLAHGQPRPQQAIEDALWDGGRQHRKPAASRPRRADRNDACGEMLPSLEGRPCDPAGKRHRMARHFRNRWRKRPAPRGTAVHYRRKRGPSHCLAGYQMAQAGRQVHPSVRNAFPRNNRRRSRPYVKFG